MIFCVCLHWSWWPQSMIKVPQNKTACRLVQFFFPEYIIDIRSKYYAKQGLVVDVRKLRLRRDLNQRSLDWNSNALPTEPLNTRLLSALWLHFWGWITQICSNLPSDKYYARWRWAVEVRKLRLEWDSNPLQSNPVAVLRVKEWRQTLVAVRWAAHNHQCWGRNQPTRNGRNSLAGWLSW